MSRLTGKASYESRLSSSKIMSTDIFIHLKAVNTKVPFDDNENGVAPLVTSENAEVILDQYIVVLKKNTEKANILKHHECIHGHVESEKFNFTKRGLFDEQLFSGIRHVYDLDDFKGYSGRFSNELLDKIRRSEEVAYVEKDQLVYASKLEKNAPWGLARISQRSRLTLGNYNKYNYDRRAGRGTVVYVIDTGINIDHDDFEGRASWGVTVPDGDEDIDGHGHGTHVAGTIAGKRYGVSKKAKVVAIKVLRSNGSGSMSDVIKGIEFATELYLEEVAKARRERRRFRGGAANMSLGGGKSQSLDLAAVDNGLIFAVAAGNDNKDACNYSPAASQKAITVGATTVGDERAWFSNHGQCVDVFAPGQDITSTWIGSSTATNTISGTSMASPHVAGLVAYYLSIEPERDSDYFTLTSLATPEKVKSNIIRFATKDAIEAPLPPNTPNLLIFNRYNENDCFNDYE
nr:2193_t:CDS:2 [Entrophospora candida]CAG8480997.1 11974_t:CDS:2 [Entrophospora candida]